MVAFKAVHEVDALATIIPFRSRHSEVASHPSDCPPDPPPSAVTLAPHRVAEQLSLFDTGPVR
jgi:hypothetical protein